MSYEPVFCSNVGGFRQSEASLGAGTVGPDRFGGSWRGDEVYVSGRCDGSCRLLSESEAAQRMGISEARLREVSDFHRELVAMGYRPFGRAPEWMGNRCFYSAETLDHWFGDRS